MPGLAPTYLFTFPRPVKELKNSQVTNCQRETVLSLYFGPDPDSLYLLSVCLRELAFSVACWVDPDCCLSMSVGSSPFFFLWSDALCFLKQAIAVGYWRKPICSSVRLVFRRGDDRWNWTEIVKRKAKKIVIEKDRNSPFVKSPNTLISPYLYHGVPSGRVHGIGVISLHPRLHDTVWICD